MQVFSRLWYVDPDLAEDYKNSCWIVEGLPNATFTDWHRKRIEYLESLVGGENNGENKRVFP